MRKIPIAFLPRMEQSSLVLVLQTLQLNNCISPHYTTLITLQPVSWCVWCFILQMSSFPPPTSNISSSFQWHINVFISNQWWICWPIRFLGNTYRRLQFPPRLRNMRLYNIQPIQTSVQSLYIHHSLIEVRGELTSPDCLISGDLALCQR